MGKFRDQILGNDDKTMDQVCKHLTNGGCIIDLCEVWDIPYFEVMEWIHSDDELSERYQKALVDRDEWVKQRMLKELKQIAFGDIRKVFNPGSGSIKVPSEWDDETSSIVESIAITQKHGKDGESEETFKIKTNSKLKAMELYGKHMKMFTDKVELEGEVKLEDILAKVHKREQKED